MTTVKKISYFQIYEENLLEAVLKQSWQWVLTVLEGEQDTLFFSFFFLLANCLHSLSDTYWKYEIPL